MLYEQVKGRGIIGNSGTLNVLLSDTQTQHFDVPMVTLPIVTPEGKDCHGMHLAYSGMHINYYYHYDC